MVDAPPQSLKTYRGNCHCGLFVYEVDLPTITTVDECNCSLCSKRGFLWAAVSNPVQFRIIKGDENALTSYSFGSMARHYKFCPHCGTGVLSRSIISPADPSIAINTHSIQDLDTWSLERKTIDGAALDPKYTHPSYTGPLPAEEVSSGKIHTGSCHCGRVQVALSSKPIDETFAEPVGECKCSICERNAYVWIWPLGVNVVLHGKEDDVGQYLCGRRVVAKTFCRVCGVPLTNKPVELPEEQVMGLTDEDRKGYEKIKLMHPVNVRVLENIYLTELNVMRLTAGLDLLPTYVNP